MPTRYEYALDHNGEWRWIALAESGETEAISPVGYPHLQDCLHAVALMQVPGNLAVAAAVEVPTSTLMPVPALEEVPQRAALSRLHRRL
jgi:uncharacterized protein YegP (UPF0339 family)